MAEIRLEAIVHQFTIVNSIFYFQKATFFGIHVDEFFALIARLESRYTGNSIGIILPVYRYRKFLVPNNPRILHAISKQTASNMFHIELKVH